MSDFNLSKYLKNNSLLKEANYKDVPAEDPIGVAITQFAKLAQRAKLLEKELEAIKKEQAEISPTISAALIGLDSVEENALRVNELFISFKQRGHTRQTVSWAKTFDDLYKNLDETLKALANDIKNSHTSTNDVKPSYTIGNITESGNSLESGLNRFIRRTEKINSVIDKLLKKVS